eukprot:Skav225310  [mRNA]  locus=scaffold23:73752:79772:- [translate_table: standard]
MTAVSSVTVLQCTMAMHISCFCDLEDQLWSSEEVEDLEIELDEEIEDLKIELEEDWGLRDCLENEFAQNDGGLKTACPCDKKADQNPPRLSSASTQAPPPDEEEISFGAEELHDPSEEKQLLHPNGMTHPAIEFDSWYWALDRGDADRASELERCASEGYCMFLNGLFMWNAQYPQMVQPFLTTVMQWYFSGEGRLAGLGRIFCSTMLEEVPSVRRPLLVDLLSLTRTKGVSPDLYANFINLLKCCSSVYQHLGRDSVAELMDSVRSWTDEHLKNRCLCEIIVIVNAVLTDESEAVLANRCFKHMIHFKIQGKLDEEAAQYQKVVDLLKQSS